MNRRLSLRMLKIVASCVLVVGIVRVLLNINALYVNRITRFADAVRTSVLETRGKMVKLDENVRADTVANAFGGAQDLEFTSHDLQRYIPAERLAVAIGLGDGANCRYSAYRLPYIADYRGLMVVRAGADGSLLDYMIVYDGGEDE